MKYLKIVLYFVCAVALCIPLVLVIFQGNQDAQASGNTVISKVNINSEVCKTGDVEKCIEARDNALSQENYYEAFTYLRTLCEKYKDSKSCYLTYKTYFQMQGSNQRLVYPTKITLFEVLYYLDLGCRLNNYEACMQAGRINEFGVKPGSSQVLYGYNIPYDPQEAKRYYKKVCNSISDDAQEACNKVFNLSIRSRELEGAFD